MPKCAALCVDIICWLCVLISACLVSGWSSEGVLERRRRLQRGQDLQPRPLAHLRRRGHQVDQFALCHCWQMWSGLKKLYPLFSLLWLISSCCPLSLSLSLFSLFLSHTLFKVSHVLECHRLGKIKLIKKRNCLIIEKGGNNTIEMNFNSNYWLNRTLRLARKEQPSTSTK